MRIANNLIGRKAQVLGNKNGLKYQIVEIVAMIRTRHGWLISVLDSNGRIHEDFPPGWLKVLDQAVANTEKSP